jgi:hypothetical protein
MGTRRIEVCRALLTATVLGFGCIGSGVLVSAARAECVNQPLRAQQVYALRLPDCRAYEQVSQVDKNATDALGSPGLVQSSPSGSRVTYFSLLPFPGVPGAQEYPTYLSTRGATEGWSTQGLVPESSPSPFGGAGVLALTGDLTKTIVEAREPPLAEGAAPGRANPYIRDNATGSYRLLAPTPESGTPRFADASSDDSRLIFESSEHLTENAAPGVVNLYEWDNGQLNLLGLLPDGEVPKEGTVAGPGGPALEEGTLPGGATSGFYTQDTVSEDGSRVFFSDVETGHIYLREPQAKKTIGVSAGRAYWRAASPDGSEVFYTEGEGENRNLYRFSLNGEVQQREALTSGAAGVLGTLGVSNDGSFAYFVATGVLSGNNAEGHAPVEGAANLYMWHEGAGPVFIAGLEVGTGLEGADKPDWRDVVVSAETAGPAQGGKSSRVTPDGQTVLFSTRAQLTPYSNAGHIELYVYNATTGKVVCVSCHPNGIPATRSAYLTSEQRLVLSLVPRDAFLTRNLSADGGRVFFQTVEALVSQDTNGQVNVYEWEREALGVCEHASEGFSASSGGCLHLISTGTSSDQSYFGDASATGSDVFFFTRQSLVGQDQDNNNDIYDARVDGGIAEQNPSSLPAPCVSEACRGALGLPPVFGAPSSATFAGSGNLAPRVSTPATRPKAKPLTRAQKLARALKACKKTPKKKRRACESQAKKRYGKKAVKSTRAHQAGGRSHS